MDLARTIGLMAGILTTLSFLPQVIRTIRIRSARDFSLAMLLFFVLGIICWLIYGILVREWPIIAANCITLVLAFILLFCKFKYP